MTKQYIGFVNDHSGSMGHLAQAAIVDYNATIKAVKDAATREMLDTIVSVIGIGVGAGGVQRQVVVSNPHVLKPVTKWPTPGGTPLYDGIGNMIELFKSLPDYDNQNVSFLVIATTDGEECSSRIYNATTLRRELDALDRDGRWTFAFRVPEGYSRTLKPLGIPAGNIQEWGTTAEGMAKSTAATEQAFNQFYATRSAGSKSSTVFYADASGISKKDLKKNLLDVSNEISLYVVPTHKTGVEIRPFILEHRAEYLKGSAFYQLTKTEARVQETKLIVIRDRADGKMYSGADARSLIGLPTKGNARLHPGDHGSYDIFIQSTSTNRKLVGGTGVLYWKAIGVPFKPEDEPYLQPAPATNAAGVVVLPAVPVSTKPTPSPIPAAKKPAGAPVPMVDGKPVRFFATRDEARKHGSAKDVTNYPGTVHGGKRWFVFI